MPASQPADARGIPESQALVEAERSGRPFLVFRDRDDRQKLFIFEPSSTSASVGRRPSSDVVLDWDDHVSRQHARFERLEEGWLLVDDGLSSNGTFVNEERLSGRRRLDDGDVLRFGTTTVVFRLPEAGPIPAPDAAEKPAAVALSSTQRRVLVALCRPCKDSATSAGPASDEQIAAELVMSAGEVRDHLKVLSAKLGFARLPQAEARVHLVEHAFSSGLISERDF